MFHKNLWCVDKLTKLLNLASEDKLHPGAGGGKSKGKQQTREKNQIVWTNLPLTPRIKKTFLCGEREGKEAGTFA